MATVDNKKLILSKESAQFLLEGLRFFQNNPQAREWHNLDKNTFLLLARDIAQFYPDEQETLGEYLVRFEFFLRRVVNNEELAPSLPQNLKELVAAFEIFQKEKNAKTKAEGIDLPTTQDINLEDWIKFLQEKHTIQRVEKEIRENPVFVSLPKQQEEGLRKALVKRIASVVPRSAVPSQEEEVVATEEINNILNQGIVGLTLEGRDPLVKQISEQIRFLTVPPEEEQPLSPAEQVLTQAVTRTIKNKTPIKEPEQVLQVAEAITRTLAQKTPRLTEQKENLLSEIERFSLTEQVINASLPEIVELFTHPTTTTTPNLSPEESQDFLQELTKETAQPLLSLSVLLGEEARVDSLHLPKARRNQEGLVFSQVSENPLLIYQLAPEEGQTPLAAQMRQVVDHHGFNSKSAEVLSYQNEEVSGLINNLTGKTSLWWQNQINLFRAKGENQNLVEQAVKGFNFQIRFERNFPQLNGFYHQAVSWAKPQQLLSRITHPAFGPLKTKIGDWWQNTALAKRIAQSAKSKSLLFLKKTLGSFNFFGTGARKGLQVMAKKGAIKAVGLLAKKLAATKIGALLGSIAPGVGNLIGAVAGFGFDLIKGGLGFFSRFLQKVSGGETEAEETIKASFGPLGKVALSPIVLIIVGMPVLIFSLTLGLFQFEGSALVVGDEEIISGIPFSQLPTKEPLPDSHFAEWLAAILQECPATGPNGYINRRNFPEVAKCLANAGVSENVINALEDSARRFSSLQCVGFVRAVELGQGRVLPGCGNAKDFANCPAIRNSDIYEYTDCQNLKVGAIGVTTGGTYGHVGIITGIETSDSGLIRVRLVSAFGTSSERGGRIVVHEFPCSSFDALIQPKN